MFISAVGSTQLFTSKDSMSCHSQELDDKSSQNANDVWLKAPGEKGALLAAGLSSHTP